MEHVITESCEIWGKGNYVLLLFVVCTFVGRGYEFLASQTVIPPLSYCNICALYRNVFSDTCPIAFSRSE